MKIDFNNIEKKSLPNFKGGELQLDARMYVDDKNRIMSGELIPGSSIGTHTHTDSSEIIFVLSGTGTVICDGAEEIVSAGECHYCPKGSTHTFINKGDELVKFYAVVPQQ